MVKKIQIKFVITFLVLFLFLLFIGSGNVISPFYGDLNLIDEGQYMAWIGHMRAGDLLYKDTYAAYGPLLIYPYYLFSKLFDPTFFTLRIFYGVFGMLLSVSVVFLILSKLKVSFPLQVFCAFILCFIPGFGLRQAAGLFAIFLSYQAFENKKSYLWSFLAGISIALSFLVSSDMGIFAAAVIVTMSFIVFLNTEDFRTYFKRIGVIILGSLSVFLAFYLFAGSEGWFGFYLSSVLDDLFSYSGIGIPVGKKFPNILELFPVTTNVIVLFKFILSKEILNYWIFLFYIIILIFFFIKFMLKKTHSDDLLSFRIVLFGLLLSTILIGREGHFVFVVPVVIILLAIYANILIKFSKKTKNSTDKYFSVFILLLIILFCLRLISIYRVHFNKIPLAIASAGVNKNYIHGVWGVSFSKETEKDIRTIQNFVDNNTKRDERIFFFSNNPGMYLLVDRVSPSRFDLPEVANTRGKRLEIINDLESDKTKYVIEYTKAYDVEGISNRTRLPEVMSYLKENYSVSSQGNFIIYTRNN